MRRKCKYCGIEYDGAPGSSACPACADRAKRDVIRIRTCRQCGIQFPGGPHAFFCSECRAARRAESDRRRHKNGPQRPIGSTDQCTVCGKDYIVNSGRQKYCPGCAKDATRAVGRVQSLEWARANMPPEKRRAERKAAAAEIPCAVCGKLFVPSSTAITCSTECSCELAKRNRSEYGRANRETINKQKAANRVAAEREMTPEEYRAYRDKINAQARENYRKRKGQ